MKRFLLILIVGLISTSLFGQALTGTKTIKYTGGDYSSISAAITALNSNGVGSGGVTFNIDANFNEVASNLIITVTGTSTNPIVFQKSGTGANPTITAGTGTSTAVDGIIKLSGTDYITFNGINLQDTSANTTTTTQMEWGFALLKDPTDSNGCQHVTIKNCNISLNKANTVTVGINSYNMLSTGTSLSSISGIWNITQTNSYNKFQNNTITNVYRAINLYGSSVVFDQNNEFDGNTITDFGGSTTLYLLYLYYQNNLKVINNTISGGSAQTTTAYYIYNSTATSANAEISNNKLYLANNSTSSTVYCLYNSAGSTASNNTIKIYNNLIRGFSANASWTGSFYGIYATTSAQNLIIRKNTIDSITLPGTSGLVYPIYALSASVIQNIDSNSINNITRTTSTGAFYGIYSTSASTKKYINNNILFNLGSSGTSVYGIHSTSADSVFIFNNDISNLNTASTGSPTVAGIYIGSGTSVFAFNNFISRLTAPNGTSTNSVSGIYVSGSTSSSVYYNTIYLNASSSSSTFGTSGIYASSTPTLDLRNNIIYNLSTPGSGGVSATLRYSSLPTTYATTSNNNLFYCGTPSSRNLIYYDGTNSDSTIAQFKARFSPGRDANSITESTTPFINVATSPYNLHLSTSTATQCESGAAPITSPISIITDYDGNTRNATTPDIGADEGNFTAADFTAPVITYTSLSNTPYTSARTLTTTIVDPSGVPTSGSGLPRLFWRINNGSYSTVTATYVSGSTYTFTFGSGVTIGDTVFYYLLAQDNAGTPNVGSKPIGAGGLSAFPPTATTPPSNPDFYAILPSLSGTFNVGTGQTYTTLTAAIADYNYKFQTGPITFVLTDTLYSSSETFPIIINENPGVSWVNRLTIKPATGNNAVIKGSASPSLIKINGADYITIDGSNNGTNSRNLSIVNTITSGTNAVIWISSLGTSAGATNNIIKNCKISSGYNTSSSYGIFVGGTSVGSSGNDNDATRIENNQIYRVYYGISTYASTSGPNDSLIISNNTIGDDSSSNSIGYRGIWVTASNSPIIENNEVNNIYTTGSLSIAGIHVDVNNPGFIIRNNKIHYLRSLSTSLYGAYGINISSATGNTSGRIYNNIIYDLVTAGDGTSTTYNPFGIRLVGGSNYDIYSNSVYLSDSFTVQNTTIDYSACLILTATSVANVSVLNNIFANDMTGYTGSKCFAVYAASAASFDTIDYNNFWVDGPNGILGYAAGDKSTLNDWQTATGKDNNSIFGNPSFASKYDLSFGSGFPNNHGIPTFVMKDFNDSLRSATTPDIGALEISLKPKAVTGAKSAVTSTSANLSGIANAYNEGTTALSFEYGTTTSYGASIAGTPATIGGYGDSSVTASLSGLSPYTMYHYRLKASNASGISYGEDSTFSTPAIPAIVTTGSATAVTDSSATLNALVNANNAPTYVRFYYGTNTSYTDTVTATPFPVTGGTATAVSAVIKGLLPNTMYYYKVFAYGPGGNVSGADSSFTTVMLPPVATTLAASSLSANSAQLNGSVKANNANTEVFFDWGTTTAYGNIDTADQSPVGGLIFTGVDYTLTGLNPNTNYHYRVRAENAAGTSNGSDISFKTTAIPPDAETWSATGITYSNATLNAAVNANNSDAYVYFQWGKTSSFGNTIVGNPDTIKGIGYKFVMAILTGLDPNTTYYYRVVASNTAGVTFGFDSSFTTAALAPIANTGSAISVQNFTATLTGDVVAYNSSTLVEFEYGTTSSYGNKIPAIQSPVNGMVTVNVSADLTLLNPGTTYHYRIVATNQAGTVYGADSMFTTIFIALPKAITNEATNINSRDALLNGTVDPQNDMSYFTFEWGETTAYGNSVNANPSQSSGMGMLNVDYPLTGLNPNTEYHYRVVASNSLGTTYGNDTFFYTLAEAPVVINTGASDISNVDAQLNGIVNALNSQTDVEFEYGLTTAYGNTITAVQSPINGMSDESVDAYVVGLTPGTTYHYRIKATNIAGTAYSNDTTFTTGTDMPSVTTAAVTNIGDNTADCGGNVTSDGGDPVTARGVVWSTSPDPEVTLTTKTVDGAGLGTFNSNITGLSPKTTYYVRAYATNSTGTAYGEEKTFTTTSISIDIAEFHGLKIYSYGNSLFIRISDETADVAVYDMAGKLILSKNAISNTTLNPVRNASGIYLVKAIIDGQVYSKKVVLE